MRFWVKTELPQLYISQLISYLSDGSTSRFLVSNFSNSFISTGLNIFLSEGGYFFKYFFGRMGRFSKPPPQLGQTLCRISSTHVLQKVHSKPQIMASVLLGNSGLSQFSQFNLISTMVI